MKSVFMIVICLFEITKLASQEFPSIYVQTDKDIYSRGEVVFAKGYTKADPSTYAVVEVYTMDGMRVDQLVFPKSENSFSCSFNPVNYPANQYLILRAFTPASSAKGHDYKKSFIILDERNCPTAPYLVHGVVSKPLIPVRLQLDSADIDHSGSCQISLYLSALDTMDLSLSITSQTRIMELDSNATITVLDLNPHLQNSSNALLPDSLLSFSGHIDRHTAQKGKPLSFPGFLSIPGAGNNFMVIETDSAGNFRLDNLTFRGTADFHYQKPEGYKEQLILDSTIYPNFSLHADSIKTNSSYAEIAPKPSTDFVPNNDHIDTLVVHSKAKLHFLDDRYTSNIFASFGDYSFDMRDEQGYVNLFEYLKANVPGLTTEGPNHDVVKFSNAIPMFFLDEQPITKEALSNTIADRVEQIAYVKVFRNFIGSFVKRGKLAFGPAIAIYRKKDGDLPSKLSNHLLLKGFAPTYSFDSGYSANTAGMFKTLLWQPEIVIAPTDGITRLVLKFEKTAGLRHAQVKLEGIDRQGRIIQGSWDVTLQ